MKTARKPTETPQRIAPPALSVNIDIDPLVEVVRRHVKLTPQATRLIKGEFAQLFRNPTISGSTRKPTATKTEPAADPVLTTQDAADLVGVSRPYLVARIEPAPGPPIRRPGLAPPGAGPAPQGPGPARRRPRQRDLRGLSSVIPVVADADTRFGATTRALLIHLDYQGLIRLHWISLILDELSRALVDTGRKPDAESARQHEQLMRAALPQAQIPTQRVQARFAGVEPAMRSAKDVHVAACAATILADGFYPGIEVQRPDAFLLEQFQQDPTSVASAFACLRATLRSEPEPDQLLERLAADGQGLTAAALHDAGRQGAVRL